MYEASFETVTAIMATGLPACQPRSTIAKEHGARQTPFVRQCGREELEVQEQANFDSKTGELNIPTLEDKVMDGGQRTTKDSIRQAASGLRNDGRRFYKYVKKHIRLRRKEKDTTVQTIHIVPEDDESRWARRSASSAASRTSVDTSLSTDSSSSSRDDTLEVVHDMDYEFNPDL